MSKKKDFIKGGYDIADKISEKMKKRMRAGKLKIGSDKKDPDVKKMIDDVIGKPTDIKLVKPKKPKKPKKMNTGGVARKGKGSKEFTGEEQLEIKRQAAKQRIEKEKERKLEELKSRRYEKPRAGKAARYAKKVSKPKNFKGGGLAKRGLGKAFINSKR